MSLFAEDAYTEPTAVFRPLPQLLAMDMVGGRWLFPDDAATNLSRLGTLLLGLQPQIIKPPSFIQFHNGAIL